MNTCYGCPVIYLCSHKFVPMWQILKSLLDAILQSEGFKSAGVLTYAVRAKNISSLKPPLDLRLVYSITTLFTCSPISGLVLLKPTCPRVKRVSNC